MRAWDPYHPVGTSTPDITAATLYSLNTLAPSLDFLASNVYGPALASNINIGANTASGVQNPLTVKLPFSPTGTPYTVVPTYANGILGGCCNNGATCSVSGLFGATGSAITAAITNASCIWTRPFLISELGPDNWWEVAQTPWGDWLESTSSQKALQYARNWQTATATASTAYTNIAQVSGGFGGGGGLMGGMCFGTYLFSYGWVWQATATWINALNAYPYTSMAAYRGLMAGNEQIEPVDTFISLLGGAKPANQAPTIAAPGITVNGQTQDMNVAIQIGSVAVAQVSASDPNGDTLSYTWLVLPFPDAPTNHTTLAPVPFDLLSSSPAKGMMTFSPPETPGYYRLTVWVWDGKGKAATHTLPFVAVLTPTPISAYVTADTFVTDYSPSGTPAAPAGNLPYLAALWNGNPRDGNPAGTGYNLGSNQFTYLLFTVPSSWPAGTRPGQVTVAMFVQGGAPVNNIGTSPNGYFLYGTPAWAAAAEATMTWPNAPCTSTSPTPTTGTGTCANSVAGVAQVAPYPPISQFTPPFQPPGVAQPPGLQMNGNYLYWDVTTYAAPLIASGTKTLSFMLLANGPAGRSTFFTSQESNPGMLNAPYISLQPPSTATTVAAVLALSGTTPMTAAAITALKASLASSIPGIPATAISVTLVGGQVTASLTLSASQAALLTPAAQAAFTAGLAADLHMDPSNVAVSSPTPVVARRRGLFQSASAAPALVELPLTLTGFNAPSNTTGLPDPTAQLIANAIVGIVANSSSMTVAGLTAAGVAPQSLAVGEPPCVWHHIAVAVPSQPDPPAVGRRHLRQASGGASSSSAMLSNSVANGAVSSAMTSQGFPTDVGKAGRFARPSPALAAMNPFEKFRNQKVAPAPPAPGTLVVTLQSAGANSIQVLVVVAVVSLFMSGVAVCAAASALMRIEGGARVKGGSAPGKENSSGSGLVAGSGGSGRSKRGGRKLAGPSA